MDYRLGMFSLFNVNADACLRFRNLVIKFVHSLDFEVSGCLGFWFTSPTYNTLVLPHQLTILWFTSPTYNTLVLPHQLTILFCRPRHLYFKKALLLILVEVRKELLAKFLFRSVLVCSDAFILTFLSPKIIFSCI